MTGVRFGRIEIIPPDLAPSIIIPPGNDCQYPVIFLYWALASLPTTAKHFNGISCCLVQTLLSRPERRHGAAEAMSYRQGLTRQANCASHHSLTKKQLDEVAECAGTCGFPRRRRQRYLKNRRTRIIQHRSSASPGSISDPKNIPSPIDIFKAQPHDLRDLRTGRWSVDR
jgi:hypothetical protein